MLAIPLPKAPQFEVKNNKSAKLIIEPLFPGYGTTLGNVLRRVLLSSLPGTAVRAIKVQGVGHEFTTLDHVKEDAIQLTQNIKKIRIKAQTNLEAPITMTLAASGETDVKAGDIQAPSDIEIVNKDLVIATLTNAKAKLDMELIVSSGLGYVAAEAQAEATTTDEGSPDAQTINVDSIFGPIVQVGLDVSNVRVGQMTNFDKLILAIETDGTRTPQEAVAEALDIILGQLNFIKTGDTETQAEPNTEAEDPDSTEAEPENGDAAETPHT